MKRTQILQIEMVSKYRRKMWRKAKLYYMDIERILKQGLIIQISKQTEH